MASWDLIYWGLFFAGVVYHWALRFVAMREELWPALLQLLAARRRPWT